MNMLEKQSAVLAHKSPSLYFLDLFLTYSHIFTAKCMHSLEEGEVISWT